MTPLTLRLGDRTVVARVDASGHVHIGDTAFVVTPQSPGLYTVDEGQRRWVVAVANQGDERWVSVNGHVSVLEVEASTSRPTRRKGARADTMMAPMPATVVQVLVSPGQAVAEGDTVLVLEAMKMELPVRASRAGTVAAVRCQAGELVQPGVVLIELA